MGTPTAREISPATAASSSPIRIHTVQIRKVAAASTVGVGQLSGQGSGHGSDFAVGLQGEEDSAVDQAEEHQGSPPSMP